jgi:lysozyme family protein
MSKQSKGEIVAAINALITRRGNTTNAAEKAAINDAISKLNGALQDIEHAGLLQAVQIISSATDELEKVVASARRGPFDTFLEDIQGVMGRLQDQQAAILTAESLPSADVTSPSPLAPSAIAAALPAAAPRKPANSTVFTDLSAEYQSFFDACHVRPEFQGNVDFYVSRLKKFKNVYGDVGADLNIPWYVIGILHGLECGFNFGTHLHNGDPLDARTTHVPANRPTKGKPPFTWRDSARDAMIYKGYDKVRDWSVPSVLYLLEKYNGFGYRKLSIPSPYLWSFSNLYVKGKYVADHKFDPDAVSRQCGAGCVIKALKSEGIV